MKGLYTLTRKAVFASGVRPFPGFAKAFSSLAERRNADANRVTPRTNLLRGGARPRGKSRAGESKGEEGSRDEERRARARRGGATTNGVRRARVRRSNQLTENNRLETWLLCTTHSLKEHLAERCTCLAAAAREQTNAGNCI